jgi:hypothetical protein
MAVDFTQIVGSLRFGTEFRSQSQERQRMRKLLPSQRFEKFLPALTCD